jgi:hypothetical protein
MATPKDAELILELYKLRTEATMRESRDIMAKFQPTSFAEIQALQRAAGSRENAAWRQTISYWEMCAALVLAGTLDAELFLDTNGENFFYYARMTPYFEEYSKASGQPFMPKLTKLIETNPAYQQRYTMMMARMEAQKKQAAGA